MSARMATPSVPITAKAPANRVRGEASIQAGGVALRLRPTFGALVAAEDELGPLFALVERASAGELRLAEMVALFWHCVDARPDALTREAFGEAVLAGGLATATPALRSILRQILKGAG